MTTILTDTRGKYIPFIADNDYRLPVLEYPYYDPVELGFEKLPLDNPLKIESALQLYAKGVSRYTGSGETTTTTAPIILDLLATVKTAHAITLSPSIITLDEDNNYTSFAAVDANEGVNWTLAPVDNRITVSPSSGMGRAAVVIKKAPAFNLSGHFVNVPLTATSTVNPTTYPDIEGNYTESDSAEVHIEQYIPVRNALIPRMGADGRPQDTELLSPDSCILTPLFNDPANELTGNYAIFAMTSVDDILTIDADEAVVLDKIEIRGQNTRRLIAANTYKGGAAVAFSLYGANDPASTWTLLRNGSTVTDVPAVTETAYAVGEWATSYDSYEPSIITNTGATAYRYYRLVPINRSSNGAELSFAMQRLNLFQRVNSTSVSVPDVKITSAAVCGLPSAVSQSFDHSLSIYGFAGRFTTGLYSSGNSLATNTGTLCSAALQNLEKYPTVEIEFDVPHRVRSWTLQSVGKGGYENTGAVFESFATVLVLQGRTLDGKWKILDLARTPNESVYNYETGESSYHALYTDDKIRVDRAVQHPALVDKLRISAIAVQWAENGSLAQGGFVWFPKIQVFAGVPIVPRMTASSVDNVAVRANSSDNGMQVFDRAVSGSNIATVGNRAWYINNNHFLLEDVAENGNISQFGSYQSKGWLSIIFPLTRLLGYLYSIDNLPERSDTHANTSYAASLYFEGRTVADNNETLEPSQGHWDFIDLVSLDHCLGHKEFGVSTATLIAEVNQSTLNTYVQNLLSSSVSLLLSPDSFLMNRNDRHIIRYDGTTEQWYDDGMRLEPGTTASNQFNNLTTAELLAEAGQARLNSVALVRGQSMQPPWTVIPDKATIVNQRDAKRMIYDLAAKTWSEVPNNDAIYHVHNRTHYADLKDAVDNLLTLAQLRCTVQSIMNTERPSVAGEPVAMPEMQFFGLPAETINNGAVATTTYLKAEDVSGNLHDVLGKHQRLPYQSYYYGYYSYSTTFRFYLGEVQNIKSTDKKLYVSFLNTSGTMTTQSVNIDNAYNSTPYREISISGDHRALTYFELYIKSANDEKIVLSSGYTGG